jgi:hypothetical protein
MKIKTSFYPISIIYVLLFVTLLFSIPRLKVLSKSLNDFNSVFMNDKDMYRLLLTIDENKLTEIQIHKNDKQADLLATYIKNRNIENNSDTYIMVGKTIYRLKKMNKNSSNYIAEVEHISGLKESGTFVADVLYFK